MSGIKRVVLVAKAGASENLRIATDLGDRNIRTIPSSGGNLFNDPTNGGWLLR